MEGQESYELDTSQGKIQKDLDYAHISMYMVLGVKPAYTRPLVACTNFHMFLGMV